MKSIPSPLIDVLSAESYEAEHIPGAVNLCVYETAFINKVRDAFPDSSDEIHLYGFNDATEEARTAIAKLKDAGYENVSAIPGGIEGWKKEGREIAGKGPRFHEDTGIFNLDLSASFIRWTGSNLLNFHHGMLKLDAGQVVLKNGELTGGNFRIDMLSLSCSDLTDSSLNAMLIHHLRSDDFFAVDTHPYAEFVIESAHLIEEINGSPNCTIKGNLALRGTVSPLEVNATSGKLPDGGFTAHAFTRFDRTLWGSIYGSGKFFSRVGMHLVDDLVQIHVHIVTEATPSTGHPG